ncbi:MAG: hypothetical protein WCF84_25100 [Anaerolineae bacterium]
MNPEIERWRKYLRYDPTRFLLDAEANPSVFLWYLIDVAHRPEDSSAVRAARERVLYSTPVQEIFAAQQPEGYWDPVDSLVEPRYRTTLWNLALLAELGIPRDSRRARAACEFVLQNFWDAQGHFPGLDGVATGYLIHALAYFNMAGDMRVQRAAQALADHAAREPVAEEIQVAALWALCELPDVDTIRARILARLGDSLAQRAEFGPITFPPFNPSDPLFILRVLDTSLLASPRLHPIVDWVIRKQNEWAQWPLEKSLGGTLLPHLEEESPASRWTTLNAVRVIVRLVVG